MLMRCLIDVMERSLRFDSRLLPSIIEGSSPNRKGTLFTSLEDLGGNFHHRRVAGAPTARSYRCLCPVLPLKVEDSTPLMEAIMVRAGVCVDSTVTPFLAGFLRRALFSGLLELLSVSVGYVI
ncbi:hypothetical protein CC2G_003104 [Coprinopsis cinerea AmutBmut pab1-1]|nr:hypothetical protein CC2G_003104 [Coprinopsis cinerea AmutBmut pab1-1]